MKGHNQQDESRARHIPGGVPYTLMYPSTDSNPVTPDNKGMTGRGIPCVPPMNAQSCPIQQCSACLSSTGMPSQSHLVT